MRKYQLFSAILAMICLPFFAKGQGAGQCNPCNFADFLPEDSVSAQSWTGDLFRLSQMYPTAAPSAPAGGYPWSSINFKKDPAKFMQTVLNYCWEGNEAAGFVPQKNASRSWFHAPWLHYGIAGREFVHGLRMERISQAGELHPNQTRAFRNFSVTFYNEAGGSTFGQVWADPAKPDPSKAVFPEGTVWFRLVFTTADTAANPFLKNTLQWEAYIDPATSPKFGLRHTEFVNLIQVDFGVKVNSPDAPTGWVYGTFAYDGRKGAAELMNRLTPVGLQWGTDPTLTDSMVRSGKFPSETWLNIDVFDKANKANSLVQHFGRGGRLSGPIDASVTSTMSDFITACWPTVATQPSDDAPEEKIAEYFRNIASTTPFREGATPLDHGLELAMGLFNFNKANGNESGLPIYRGELNEYYEIESGSQPEVEEVKIDPPKGLVGNRVYKFIFFALLIVGMAVLLFVNLFRQKA